MFSKPKLAHTNYLTSNNIGKIKIIESILIHHCKFATTKLEANK